MRREAVESHRGSPGDIRRQFPGFRSRIHFASIFHLYTGSIWPQIGRQFPTGEPEMQEAFTPNPAHDAPAAPQGGPQANDDAIIRAVKIEKYYAQPSQNRIQVISATDLSIVPGEILSLLGPSGSGKSTMLRMLTGLSRPSAGEVYWHGKPIAEAQINVSIVFQSFALFPWLTVLENVEAPLQARGVSPVERRERSMRMLDTVGLDGFEGAYPKEL